MPAFVPATLPIRRRGPRARAGFTVGELLVAAMLMAVLAGFALPFIMRQPQLIAASAARDDALQGARFAQSTVDRELRMIGTGTLPSQPMLVYADRFAVTFNADLVTAVDDDIWAVSYDPDADPGAVLALQPPAIALPRGGAYPQAAFLGTNGTPGTAETVSYWVSPDSSSPRPNEYVLWRKVNRLDPVVVTTGVVIAPGQGFFHYDWVADSTGRIDSVRTSQLPLFHAAARHGSAADTGETGRIASRIDRVRTVRVQAAAQYRDPRAGGALGRRDVSARTTLINVTALRRSSCGTAPDASSAVALPQYRVINGTSTIDYVRVLWTSVPDDGAGERDVDRYLVYRSMNGAPFGEPLETVPSVNQSGRLYTFDDYEVRRAPTPAFPDSNQFRYAITAQDCQPQTAPMATPSTAYVRTVP